MIAPQGFTLIELVITMVIVANSLHRLPAYNSYILKSHRTDAKTALLDMASLEERYFTTQNVDSTAATDLGYPGWPAVVGSGYYEIQAANVAVTPTAPTALVPAGVPASFTITAVPVPGNMQTQDTTCTSFTISSTGAQTATPAANASTCWN